MMSYTIPYNGTTFDPVLDAWYREIDQLADAITGAYESVAEARMDAYMSLGPDFTYQRFPEHDYLARLEADMARLEGYVAERLPAPLPSRSGTSFPFVDEAPF